MKKNSQATLYGAPGRHLKGTAVFSSSGLTEATHLINEHGCVWASGLSTFHVAAGPSAVFRSGASIPTSRTLVDSPSYITLNVSPSTTRSTLNVRARNEWGQSAISH